MSALRRWGKDHAGGALLVVTGAGVVVAGLGYQMGSLRQMGSGFFPVVLGVLLLLVGAAMLATTPLRPASASAASAASSGAGESGSAGAAAAGADLGKAATVGGEHAHLAGPPVQWRGWLCIVVGVLSFVVLGAHGGLVPASFVSVFIAAMGDRDNSARSAAALAAVMTLFGVLVFHYGLKLLLPLFTWAA